MSEKYDLIIRNAVIYTMDQDRRVIMKFIPVRFGEADGIDQGRIHPLGNLHFCKFLFDCLCKAVQDLPVLYHEKMGGLAVPAAWRVSACLHDFLQPLLRDRSVLISPCASSRFDKLQHICHRQTSFLRKARNVPPACSGRGLYH